MTDVKTNPPLAVVILAAGKGSRMKSDMPKVMHKVMGLSMVNWVINAAQPLNPTKTVVVIGEGMTDVQATVAPCDTAVQVVQNGTGGALQAAMPALEGFEGDILVLLGDTPLIATETLSRLIAARHADDATGLSVLGAKLSDPTGYGRLLIGEDGTLQAIREHKDATEAERLVDVVNTGAFCLDGARVRAWLSQLDNNNAQGEYYITDLPEIARHAGVTTRIAITDDAAEMQGCNTKLDLADLERTAQHKARARFILDGVMMEDPDTVYLHHDTAIAAGVRIEPSVYFGAGVTVAQGVHIKAFCHFEKATIGAHTVIGPFARLRPDAVLGEDVKIGNFVEIKKSTIGNRSKVSHLGYVGDCDMGEDVNFGCGAITVNYDGINKFKTTIHDNVMVGSNTNLVAPVTLEQGAFIAAGSTITKDVEGNALALTRSPMKIIKDWATRHRAKG